MKKLAIVTYILFSVIFIGCGGSTQSNVAPKAIDKTITLNENKNKQILLDARDADGNSLTYKIVKAPSHGTFADGVYTPSAGYVGSDSFTYVANDGTVDSKQATVTITITADFDGDDISDATDTDDDNDGITDEKDAFPLNFSESVDTDGDGIGNNADTDDDGDGISDIIERSNGYDSLVPNQFGNSVMIFGKVEYERIHPLHNGSKSNLDSSNITVERAKEIIVKAIDSSGVEIVTTSTNSKGEYILIDIPKNSLVKIRAYAKMLKHSKWDVKVTDNTNNNSQYVLEGSLVTAGLVNTTRNLKATFLTKSSPPFAILDSVYSSMKKVLDVDNRAVFPPLTMNWSVNNIESGTYYDGNIKIMLQGDQHGDSDEYDDHIIVHEWGHYFESKFSRADSIGGQHGAGDSLDIRLAFGEGWGNAWSAMVTDDPLYFDTFNSSGWNMNIETASQDNSGWFSEASIQRILYDLYDNNDDGSDSLSLGFKPLYDVLVGTQKVTPAFTSIFTFIKALKDENVDEQGAIDAIVSRENIVTIKDIYGTSRTHRESSYPYYDLTIGSSVHIHTSSSDGVSNKLSNHQYVKFNISTTGEYIIKIKQTNGTNSDPDFTWYSTSSFKLISASEGSPNRGVEQKSISLIEGDYILDIMDAKNIANAEYIVTVTPQ